MFFLQQISNAAREAAGYAAIHSETSQCPTVSIRAARQHVPPEVPDFDCDPPSLRPPQMTGHARELIFGLNASACASPHVVGILGRRSRRQSKRL